jgi:glycosyltransferase involved in cell wall biosynthesis
MPQGASGGSEVSIVIAMPPYAKMEWLPELLSTCRPLPPCRIVVVVGREQEREALRLTAGTGCEALATSDDAGTYARRAAGASHAPGEVVLFLDGDLIVESRALLKMLEPLLYGRADAATAPRAVRVTPRCRTEAERVWGAAFNRFLRRDDMLSANLTETPYALSRKALHVLGIPSLRYPVLAYARLLGSGLRIVFPTGVPESAWGRRRFSPERLSGRVEDSSLQELEVVREHLRAIRSVVPGPRGGCTDGNRRRDIVKSWSERKRELSIREPCASASRLPSYYSGRRLSVVIPARNEEATIERQIREVRDIGPAEIIVVANGTQDRTAELALRSGARVVHVPEALGTDTGRALGASIATGDILLFVDAEPVVAAEDLYPFAVAVRHGVDVALNDSNHCLERGLPAVSAIPAMVALNQALEQKRLGASSMTMIPFAISRRALDAIGWESLLCPPRALAAAALEGLSIAAPHRVDVEKDNRLRPEKRLNGLAVEQIVGDHIEALHYIIKRKGHL